MLYRRLHLQLWFLSGSVFPTQTLLSLSSCLWLSLWWWDIGGQAGGGSLPSARECQEGEWVWSRRWESESHLVFKLAWTFPLISMGLGYFLASNNDINHWWGKKDADAALSFPQYLLYHFPFKTVWTALLSWLGGSPGWLSAPGCPWSLCYPGALLCPANLAPYSASLTLSGCPSSLPTPSNTDEQKLCKIHVTAVQSPSSAILCNNNWLNSCFIIYSSVLITKVE